jgi:hypothetical protein
LGSKATATFTSQNGKAEALQMKGNFFDTSANITDKAQNGKAPLTFTSRQTAAEANDSAPDIAVARIDRKLLSGKDLLFGQQTYAVQVAPGVDMALVAAMCICLDEKNNEGK